MRGARFLGRHRTEQRFSMYELGGFPGVCRHGRRSIGGELFVIDEALLWRLDEFEARYGLAERIEIVTRHGPAWMYVAERKFCLAKPRFAAWRQKNARRLPGVSNERGRPDRARSSTP